MEAEFKESQADIKRLPLIKRKERKKKPRKHSVTEYPPAQITITKKKKIIKLFILEKKINKKYLF